MQINLDYRGNILAEETMNPEEMIIGKKCPYCDEIVKPWHWMKHDPEGAEEELYGDDWP